MAERAFRVTRRVPVVTYDFVTLLETDDGLEAEAFRMALPNGGPGVHIEGTHPSHEWEQRPGCIYRRCKRCNGWDNGSYGSHLPCGFDVEGKSLVGLVADWRARTQQQVSDG